MSIKPNYVKRILAGQKIFEYRKKIFKREVEKIYIYSSFPEQQIVGFFTYGGYISKSPNQLWEETKNGAGITEIEFKNYFYGKTIGYALKINELMIFQKSINPYKSNKKFCPPQSFKYLESGLIL